MPRPVVKAVTKALRWEAQGPTSPGVMEEKLATFARAREEAAALIGASPHEISLQENTTAGINAVLWGLPLRPGDEVCTTNLEHPSLFVPLLYLRRRRRVKLRVVTVAPQDDDGQILSQFGGVLGPRTRLVAISHILYGTGQLLPVARIAEMAHSYGAWVLVDAAQSVGQIPVDVKQLGCDFLAFPGHKWLLGPAGTGALYVRQELVPTLTPLFVSHRAVASVRWPGPLRPVQDRLSKLELTTRSVALWWGWVVAVGLVRRLGLEAIARHDLELAQRAAQKLVAIPGVELLSPQTPQSGLLSFRVRGIDSWSVTAALWQEAKIVARTVPALKATRVSLHLFNTPEEVEILADAVFRIAKSSVLGGGPQVQLERLAMDEL